MSNLIERLPLKASLDIFSYLRRSDLDSCFKTCSGWRKIANSDELRSVWEIYSPREFAKQFRSEKCFYSRKGSQQIGDMYDEGFNKFISVITDFGIVSGKLTNFSENFYLKIFPPIVQKTEYYWMLEQIIPLEKINSIRVLNRHFPYKFAYDWHYKRSEFPKFCLVVIKTHVKTISGRLVKVSKAAMNHENFSPITFFVVEDPNRKITSKIEIGHMHCIRVLPYTPESVCVFEQDKHQAIEKSLKGRVHSIGISLITEYLIEDVPDELPKIFYDYLKKQSSKK